MKQLHLAIVAAAALAGIPAQAQQVPLAAAQEQAKAVGRYFAQSSACNWGSAAVGNAHGAAYNLAYSVVLAQQGKAAADTVVMGSPAAEPCGGPADTAARQAAFQITFEWLTRLAFAQQLNTQSDYRKDMLRLPAGIAAAEPVRAGMEAEIVKGMGRPQLDAFYAQIGQETANDFALACDGRKNNGKDVRACPPVPPEAAAFVPIAKARLDAIEAMAGRLAPALAAEAMGAFGTAYKLVEPSPLVYGQTACAAGDLVVYPAAPDTKPVGELSEMTLRRQGRPDNLGRILVRKTGTGDWSLVNKQRVTLPELVPQLYAIEFRYCPG